MLRVAYYILDFRFRFYMQVLTSSWLLNGEPRQATFTSLPKLCAKSKIE